MAYRIENMSCTIESYNIDIVTWSKCAHCDNVVRINEKDYLNLYAGENGYNTGSYLFCKDGLWSAMSEGEYIKAGKLLFMQEEVINFYA